MTFSCWLILAGYGKCRGIEQFRARIVTDRTIFSQKKKPLDRWWQELSVHRSPPKLQKEPKWKMSNKRASMENMRELWQRFKNGEWDNTRNCRKAEEGIKRRGMLTVRKRGEENQTIVRHKSADAWISDLPNTNTVLRKKLRCYVMDEIPDEIMNTVNIEWH